MAHIFSNNELALSVFNDLAEKIVKILGSKSKIVHLPERAGDVKHSSACVDKLMSTGFKPSYTFDEGLEIAVKAYKEALGK